MGKRNNSIIISVVLVAFLVGTIFSPPNYVDAIPPWANDIIQSINDIVLGVTPVDLNSASTIGGSSISTGAHTVDTVLTEAEVDGFANNNGYSTGAHTVDTVLTEAQVDGFVNNNGFSTGAHTVDTNTNAATLCANGQFLNGDGTCDPVPTGDITAVNAGFGLVGGGSSGVVLLSVDTNKIQSKIGRICPPGESIRAITGSGAVLCEDRLKFGYEIVSKSVNVPAGRELGSSVICPEHKVVVGGGVSGLSVITSILGSFPINEHAWIIEVFNKNLFAGDNIIIYAVCI